MSVIMLPFVDIGRCDSCITELGVVGKSATCTLLVWCCVHDCAVDHVVMRCECGLLAVLIHVKRTYINCLWKATCWH